MKPRKSAPASIHTAEPAAGKFASFFQNIQESSTEYSIIGKDLDGRILLWNEGARRLYCYEPEEVVGRTNSIMLQARETYGREAALAAGCDAFLVKPVNTRLFAAQVTGVSAKPK